MRSLAELLERLFNESEFRAFVSEYCEDREGARSHEILVGGSGTVPLSELVRQTLERLQNRGVLDEVFFQHLERARPNLTRQIRAVAKTWDYRHSGPSYPNYPEPLTSEVSLAGESFIHRLKSFRAIAALTGGVLAVLLMTLLLIDAAWRFDPIWYGIQNVVQPKEYFLWPGNKQDSAAYRHWERNDVLYASSYDAKLRADPNHHSAFVELPLGTKVVVRSEDRAHKPSGVYSMNRWYKVVAFVEPAEGYRRGLQGGAWRLRGYMSGAVLTPIRFRSKFLNRAGHNERASVIVAFDENNWPVVRTQSLHNDECRHELKLYQEFEGFRAQGPGGILRGEGFGEDFPLSVRVCRDADCKQSSAVAQFTSLTEECELVYGQ